MRELEGREEERIAVFGRGSQFEAADFEAWAQSISFVNYTSSNRQIKELAM